MIDEKLDFYFYRCVDDGYCTFEHANLIQQYVEKKLGKLYKIDETIGKSLLTMEENDDELDEEEPKERKAMVISDDEDSHMSLNENSVSRPAISSENTLTTNTNKHLSGNNPDDVTLSPSLNPENKLSSCSPPVPSPPKGNPSPGEITKPMSPSSLSEASSPMLD